MRLSLLRDHLPEYLIEGWALGMFMVSAGVFSVLLEHPRSPVALAIGDADVGRALVGLMMGLTAIGLIYSPWGKRSGAHMNPAVTLTFLRLGKVAPLDALCYSIAQFAGGALGVLAVALALGAVFTDPPVNYAATRPGPQGLAIAFLFELLISFGLMFTVLVFTNRPRLMSWTGVAAGCLVATYITFEGPLSGMSMNPARSFASAVPAALWRDLWIYFTAPVLGMLAAAELYVRTFGRTRVDCAKLCHADEVRCIHCGYEPYPSCSRPSRRPLTDSFDYRG